MKKLLNKILFAQYLFAPEIIPLLAILYFFAMVFSVHFVLSLFVEINTTILIWVFVIAMVVFAVTFLPVMMRFASGWPSGKEEENLIDKSSPSDRIIYTLLFLASIFVFYYIYVK